MKAVICKNMKKPDTEIVSLILKTLHGFGIEAVFSDTAREDCDVVITVGGDGTILHHGKAAARLGKPLLGINTGRLGFMTSLEVHRLDELKRLKENYSVCSRMMLDVEIGGEKHLALNDAVFYKDVSSKLPEFEVSVKGIVVSEIRADGLILSTPTGSTAYALSAGGPIIEPWLDCIEFTPLCPHSLFGRPMILSAMHPVTVEFEGTPDNHAVFVSIDGEQGIEFKKGERAIISKSALRLSLIDLVPHGRGFYDKVHNKLMKPLK
ncbi:MAG: NAD(+)/NADH kinase [Oscillospiraceae bacterium]|jgi:NAD+ kinase|nr:NAD(+)/NADH kinase [Oscillospiraceae bacterium]